MGNGGERGPRLFTAREVEGQAVEYAVADGAGQARIGKLAVVGAKAMANVVKVETATCGVGLVLLAAQTREQDGERGFLLHLLDLGKRGVELFPVEDQFIGGNQVRVAQQAGARVARGRAKAVHGELVPHTLQKTDAGACVVVC